MNRTRTTDVHLALGLLLALACACTPASQDVAVRAATSVESGEYRPGALSPANWADSALERTMQLYATQAAPKSLAESGRAMVVNAVAAPGAYAGLRALRLGGSAADAVLTAALTNTALSLGTGASYAGVAALVYYDAETGRVYSMDASWNTVRNETDPLSIPGGEPSGRTSLVPGFMAGVEAAHQRFGRLPFTALFEPAIHFAEEGFEFPSFLADAVQQARPVLERLPETRAVFTGPDGQSYRAGDRVRQPALAATLRRVTAEGADYMYTGDWGLKLVEAVRREGGHMTLEDLAAYEVIWSEPAHTTYRAYDVFAPGEPSLGGVNTVEALNLLEEADVAGLGHYTRSSAALYRFMRIAHVQHVMNWVDPDIRSAALPKPTTSQPARGTREHARLLWEAMGSEGWEEALDADDRTRRGSVPDGHTDAVVAVDERSNVAALTYTSNTGGWGRTGIFVDGVSIPDPGAFSQSIIARTGPGSRLPIALNPLLILDDGAPVLGSAAIGPGIHESTLQNVVNVLDFGMDPAQANEAPEFLLYLYAPIEERMRDFPVYTRAVGAGEFGAALLDSIRAMGQPVVEVESGPARGLRGYWIGIRIDPATGVLQGATSRFFGGLAEGF